MTDTAIVLAGGFGTRLKNVVTDLPKPMAPVNGVPFLNYQLNYLKHYGITNVIISTGHLGQKITSYYGNLYNGLKITYSHEEQALGTGGGIRLAIEKSIASQTIVLNGDSFFDVNLNEFYRNHTIHAATFSLAARKVENTARYGTITLGNYPLPKETKEKTNDFYKIISFNEKTGNTAEGYINGGIYVLDKSHYLKLTNPGQNFSIEKDVFEKYFLEINIGGFLSNGYFIDIGIPEDYARAQHELKEFKYK